MVFGILVLAGVGVTSGVVGQCYRDWDYSTHENTYTWLLVFFGAQLLSLALIEPAINLIQAALLTCGCCRGALLAWMREAATAYEDFKYTLEFSLAERHH